MTDNFRIPDFEAASEYQQLLITERHAGLDPASSSVKLRKNTGFPFYLAQGGGPVEPRVKPGMTSRRQMEFYQW